MPSTSAINSVIAELPKGPPMVAVLTGGTTGIGSYVAEALAATYSKQHGSKLRVYLVGRKPERAEALIAACRTVSPDSDWRFVQSPDLALLGEVDRASAEIVRQETEAPFHGGTAHIDLLCMTHCYPIFKERSSKSPRLPKLTGTTTVQP
jgi:NAD(P)-dependent dehydrogenase (short-subunit alcohol dehydrogenase family)